jgi:hypothetical protein
MLNKYLPILHREINRLKNKELSSTDFMTLMMLGWRAMRPSDGMTFDDVAKCLSEILGSSVNWHDVCSRMESDK